MRWWLKDAIDHAVHPLVDKVSQLEEIKDKISQPEEEIKNKVSEPEEEIKDKANRRRR